MADLPHIGLQAFQATIAGSPLATFFDYWLGLRQALGRLPRRTEIDPAEIKQILEFIVLLDHDAERQDYLVRLAGTSVRESLKFELTGKYISDVFSADTLGQTLARYDLVRTLSLPHYIDAAREQSDGRTYEFRRLLVPLDGNSLMNCGLVRTHVDHLDTSLLDMTSEMKVICDYLVDLD